MSTAEKTIKSFREQLAQSVESQDSAESYDVSRETQNPVAINFRTAKGERSFPYTYLQDFGFSEHGDIDLFFSTGIVTVSGKNLKPLYIALRRYRVAEIAVSTPPMASTEKITVDAIAIHLHRETKL